jgi:hypothetical protein
MKNRHRVNFVCALSITLAGCGSTGLKEVGKLQAAPLMSDCMKQATAYIYNNEEKEFNVASISLDMPKANDITYIGKSIKSVLSNETESMKEYQKILQKNPTAKIVRVNLSAISDKISCEYVYFSDKKAEITQDPILFKINGPQQSHYITSDQAISKITPIEYLFELPRNQYGFRLYSLTYSDTATKPSVNNQDVLNKIGNIVASNSLLEFYDLEQPVQESLTIALSDSATAMVKTQSFVPQNPIYITPATRNQRISKLDITDNENYNAKQMEQYNQDRFVDSSTGINTTREVLNKMRNELGLGDTRFNIGNAESTELSINTNNFTREEIQQSNRQMQQESERKWGN